MPRPLKGVYAAACLVAAFGWLSAVTLGALPAAIGDPAVLLSLTLPVAFALALGFREQQRWTRPLMLLTLGLALGVAWLARSSAAAVVVSALLVALGAYLYGSRSVRAYYLGLRKLQAVTLSARDLEALVSRRHRAAS